MLGDLYQGNTFPVNLKKYNYVSTWNMFDGRNMFLISDPVTVMGEIKLVRNVWTMLSHFCARREKSTGIMSRECQMITNVFAELKFRLCRTYLITAHCALHGRLAWSSFIREEKHLLNDCKT